MTAEAERVKLIKMKKIMSILLNKLKIIKVKIKILLLKKIKSKILKEILPMETQRTLILKRDKLHTVDLRIDSLRDNTIELKRMKQILRSKIYNMRLSHLIEAAKQVLKIVVVQAH